MTETQNKWIVPGLGVIAVIIVVTGVAVSSVPSCWNQSPIPPPESPIITIPVEPPSEEVAREYGSMEVWWDDPSVERGYAEVFCVGRENIAMFLDWRLKDNSGNIIHGGLIEVGESAPTEVGAGLFAGPFLLMADLEPNPEVVTVWIRPRWDLGGAGCVDVDDNPVTEIIGIYVPPAGEGTSQDAAGFWYVRTLESYVNIYLPMISK